MRRILLLAAAMLWCGSASAATEKLLLPQKPTLSANQIAFTFAGDLWTVGREGGEARRLTSSDGLEFEAHFSPDGKWLAFTGEYDGNLDVFVVPASGGEPKRLTYHPGVDVALGWTPDGKSVLFSSGRTSYSRFNKLFTIPVEGGGLPTELPLPMGEQGAFSTDGSRIAYVPYWNRRAVPNAYIAWKQYRGGKASPIWIADLGDSRITKIPREDSNDFSPMYLNGKVFFLSDRDGPVTLFSYDPDTKDLKKVIDNQGLDYVSASAGPDGIILERFGGLELFDAKSNSVRKIGISVTADFPAVRSKYAKAGKQIRGASVSPSGARAVFEARGEIMTVPAEKGDIRNLTQTTAACERDPAWSPDGKSIAYFSDESGEYMLHLADPMGKNPSKKIALGDAPNFYTTPVWSPDSKKIAYADNRLNLWYLDVDSGKSTKVDKHTYFPSPSFDPTWSPDSQWIAYTKSMDNKLNAAFLFDTKSGKATQVTDGLSDVRSPAFDKSGKYLYFTASTDVGPTANFIDMSGMNRPVTRSVYLAVLDKSLPSPLAPESDEEGDKDEKKEKADDGDKADKPKEGDKPKDADKPANDKPASDKPTEKKVKPTKIDLDGIGQRILAMPIPARNYIGLTAGKPGTIFIIGLSSQPMRQGPGMAGFTVTKFDLKTRKTDQVQSGVSAFELTANGEKALIRQGDKWSIVPIGGGPGGGAAAMMAAMGRGGEGGSPSADSKDAKTLKTDDMEVQVDPRAEWKQMYREAWRLQRDFLYDPNYHGLDIAAAEKKYAAYLDGLCHRSDLNYLFNEMLGQLVLGHTYIGGGESPEIQPVRGGLLGADIAVKDGRYQVTKVYNGENWNPQLRAPLTQPGVNVKPGEFILAVNGRDLKATDNFYKPFVAKAGKSVNLTVGPNADGKDSRTVTVVPVESDTGLRNLDWVESNRRKVDEMTKGQVAYVYMPDTGAGGFTNFNRYFFAQVDKPAVVIDERYNGGGLAADYVIDYLRRPLLNYWTSRDGKIGSTPGGAIFGPKAMIINEFAGSGGDAMPWYFRKAGVGPLVGKRTWGGLVGISGYPQLMDGGRVTAPSFAFFTPDGKWDVENKGVAPDVEVEHDPYEIRKGRDPQLEKAVEIVMEALKKNPPPTPKKPEYPNYHKKG
jgi:tricorn protease